jgi:hypothetical protein
VEVEPVITRGAEADFFVSGVLGYGVARREESRAGERGDVCRGRRWRLKTNRLASLSGTRTVKQTVRSRGGGAAADDDGEHARRREEELGIGEVDEGDVAASCR